MSRLKQLIKDSPIHERRLEIMTFPLEDERVLVEGWLRDERMVKGYYWDGRARPPGVVHWMCVRLLVGGRPISIQDAEAEMPETPHEKCPETMKALKRIIGLPIVSGYTEKVRERIGGVKGCTHLMQLVVAMGPAALHGYWTQLSRQPRAVPTSLEEVPGLRYLINSCELWEEGGPMIKAIRAFFEGPAGHSSQV